MSRREAWQPASYDKDGRGLPNTYSKADIRAIQAVASGTASETEQKRAMDWIINHACLTYDEPFHAGQPDVTSYILGKRAVGLAIIKLIKLKPEGLDQKENT